MWIILNKHKVTAICMGKQESIVNKKYRCITIHMSNTNSSNYNIMAKYLNTLVLQHLKVSARHNLQSLFNL